MTDQDMKKLKAWWERKKEHAKAAMPWLFLWGTGTFVALGCASGIEAKREIRHHRKWTNEVEVPTLNHNVGVSRKDQQRITDLERQVNTLMEKALAETEGKEPAV